jgi:diguanylate cyclase (GGDEF)-like protein
MTAAPELQEDQAEEIKVLLVVPIIVMTEEDDEAQALGALRMGAQDHLVKSQSSRLVRTLLHAVERHRLITELHEARRSEHFLATHDALTRLPNRFFFEDQLRRALEHAARRGKQIAVLFVDLDRFKAINDTLGHGVGDELLKEVAKRLTATMRKTDLVARLGGDEFIVMIQDVGGSLGPAKVGETLIATLNETHQLAGGETSRRSWPRRARSSAPRHFCVGAIRIAAWSPRPHSFQ